jgi:hypothetical protein
MTPRSLFAVFLAPLVIAAGTSALASPVATPRTSSPTKICRADEDTFRVLTLTTFEGGVRVDYAFVRSGRATWTNMNRPLLKQFGIRAGGTFCLPKDTRLADENDAD